MRPTYGGPKRADLPFELARKIRMGFVLHLISAYVANLRAIKRFRATTSEGHLRENLLLHLWLKHPNRSVSVTREQQEGLQQGYVER